MIKVHLLNGEEFVINAEMIETMEARPDSTITLIGGKRLIVSESIDCLIERIVAYRHACLQGPKFLQL
ncbi:flagellar FlbD family protein [Heliophilum fasciatum]|uniref:Flagellar protein FlbD n=1 Tax=Heliophilum fasciatum TaxID=35700 RepID=A0A4R2RZG5_9FIRM|nr:flagellar FlbD family protein [Heliophilum fasciatum]MCW2277935.1 flagellar protein FlbD [Heliophilum fasciatum]TCP64495.1 flagellar protein FlbD [Heliophilum fasciatum]